jgi:hypothetical protein
MNLIDRYINQVGENLPEKDREDIKAEIRSIIEDTLENRSQSENRPVDEAMTIEVLKGFGSPQKMASAYLPPRYLIGPRLFPTFLMVIKIVLGIIGIVVIVTTTVSVIQQAHTTEQALPLILNGLLEGVSSALSPLGNVVFIFALIEWGMSRANEDRERNKTWDPRTLENNNDEVQVKAWERIPNIVFTMGALLVFNFYPQWIGVYFVDKAIGGWVHIPFLSEVFFQYLPFLNILWLGGIILSFGLMRSGSWQPWSRWYQIVIDVLTITLFILMATGGPLVHFAPEMLQQLGDGRTALTGLESLLITGSRALLILLAIFTGVDLIQSIVKLSKKI